MVQVYAEPLCRRHFAGVVSLAALFRAACFAAAVAISLLSAHAAGGLWAKVGLDAVAPTVHLTGDALVILESTRAGDERVWTTSPALRALLPASRVAAASVQLGEIDADADGRPEALRFTAHVAVPAGAPVHGVRALIQLEYRAGGAARVRASALAYVSHDSASPGAAFYADGRLALRQSAPLPRGALLSGALAEPLLDAAAPATAPAPGGGAAAALQLRALLASYAARNMTAAFRDDLPLWAAGAPDGGSFLLDVTIRVPPAQLVAYRPGTGELLKWGWIQFLALYAVVGFVSHALQAGAFRLRLLDTRVRTDAAPVPPCGCRF